MKIFFYIFIFLSFGICAQELPPIQSFSPIDYSAGNQNWSLSQSENNYIYVANNDGLLEYNGANWQLYPSPNGTPLRSVKVVGERIYTGCYMEFGYWTKDEFGHLNYNALSNELKDSLIEDEQFWNISEFKDWVIFQSLDRLYIYNTNNESFEILDAKTTRAAILEVNNTIYFQRINEGIFTIENGKSVLVSDDAVLKNDIVVGAFDMGNTTLIVTEKGAFYFLDQYGLNRWVISADKELSASQVYSSMRLKDGSFILGTISKGIFQLDQKGNIMRHINQENGLNNNTVLSLFEDVDHNLWLGLDNGISVLNIDSPFNEYIDEVGRVGAVYTAILFNNIRYLGTNQGLFYKREEQNGDYTLIENTKGQVWMLKQIDGTLFCGHHNGTFIINGENAKKISDFPGTWDIQKIVAGNDLLLQGNYKGLSVLERTDGQWKFKNKINGFDNSSRFFEFINAQQVLVNHDYKGVFDLKIDAGFDKVTETKKEESKGTGSSLFKYKDDIIYTTINGVFKLRTDQHKFILDSVLTSHFFGEDDPIIGILNLDGQAEKLWGFTKNNIIYVAPGKFNNEPQATKISIPSSFRKNMGVLGFESITHLKDQLYLIGMSHGYITLNLDKLKRKEYQISINAIFQEYYDSPNTEVNLKGDNIFKSSDNSFRFFFSVPNYDKYTEVNYQYQLTGIYDEWSSWTKTPDISFKNLSFGDYIFKVRAKVGNTLTKDVATYSFVIAKPWYLSNTAIALYILGSIFIVVLIHKLYKAYYKKQQDLLVLENKKRLKRKKLKAQKKIIQLNNEKLQSEIESKNRELAVSTMSIIKKNEFLNTIKEELKKTKIADPQIKAVIRTIDRNIGNEDDWKFFEEAFNNADKDFLKKVKTIHEDFTPSDLRLCAYLRLNLSSKEIAPLLNISVRSVEVKRYRLRKKMNLSHEMSLTDYILNL
ncbi:helix-turn-helix and ligand-binding sensor domain-containing protein [Arenibacter nanhaiticus]|uniref:helix-turn-helix and ligand-binding sensor domain-containing protein n=1 Tax=Arenibacter nanhaiticus TaxID=558155 RepID=UPI001FE6A861|nr:triple tyrosine motif-containing protein [Arenibacter nanhaiticus]